MIAAISEMIVALLSFYGSAAAVLNGHFGQVVLPVGKPFGIFKQETTQKVHTKNQKRHNRCKTPDSNIGSTEKLTILLTN